MNLFLDLKTFPFNKNNRIDIKTQMTLKIPERVSKIFDKPGLDKSRPFKSEKNINQDD